MKGVLKALLIILLTIALLVGAVAGFVIYKLSLIDYDDGTLKEVISTESVDAEDITPEETEYQGPGVDTSGLQEMETFPVIPDVEIQEDDDIINILLLGTDAYSGKLTDHARSDCMILVSINKTQHTVKLVSLERAIGVYMETGLKAGQYDLLTHAFRWGGAALVCDCVENHLRVEVDHYVRVSFNTVKTVVDAIGGVEVELTAQEANVLNKNNTFDGMYSDANLTAGRNILNGNNALRFARLRSIDSDWQRVERQRKVILAAVQALKGASLKQLNDLLDQTLPLIQTDMSMLEIADLMLYAPNFLTSEFDQMTIPKQGTYGFVNGNPGFAVDFETNSQILRDFLYGTGEESDE